MGNIVVSDAAANNAAVDNAAVSNTAVNGAAVNSAVEARQGMYPLRAVDRVCDIIDLLAEHPGGVTLSMLAVALALPKSSAFRYLAALEARGYVVRSDDGVGYRLGTPITDGQQLGTNGLDRLVSAARPLMSRLTGGDARVSVLATLDGTGIRYLWVESAFSGDSRIPRSGDRALLHTSASGKAIAAQLSDDQVVGLVTAAGMPQPTSSSLASPTALLRELHRIRGEGFAMSDNERGADVRGIAVPIGGQTLALGVAGRSGDLPGERVGGVVRQLRRAAVVLARDLRG